MDYGIEALEACFAGITGITTVVHICCGYPSDLKSQPEADPDEYISIAPALALSKIDQVSIECAHRALDLKNLREFGNKDIIFGVVDVGHPRVERVEQIENLVKEVLGYIGADRLQIGPDCGMIHLDPAVARGKLSDLAEAARRVRESL